MKIIKKCLSITLLSLFFISVLALAVGAATISEEFRFRGQELRLVHRAKKTTGREMVVLDNRKQGDANATPYFKLEIPANYGYSNHLTIDVNYTVENVLGINRYYKSERVYDASISNYTNSPVTRGCISILINLGI